MSEGALPIDRAALSKVFTDQRTLIAFEEVLRQALLLTPDRLAGLTNGDYVVTADQADLPNARKLEGDVGLTIDTATVGVIRLLLDVVTALGYVPASATDVTDLQAAVDGLEADPVIGYAALSAFSQGRVLDGGAGVSIDLATAGLAKVLVDVITALGYTPVDAAGDTMTGPLDVQALLQCDTFRIDQTPAANTTPSTHSIPINCDGTVYYIRLSATP